MDDAGNDLLAKAIAAMDLAGIPPTEMCEVLNANTDYLSQLIEDLSSEIIDHRKSILADILKAADLPIEDMAKGMMADLLSTSVLFLYDLVSGKSPDRGVAIRPFEPLGQVTPKLRFDAALAVIKFAMSSKFDEDEKGEVLGIPIINTDFVNNKKVPDGQEV